MDETKMDPDNTPGQARCKYCNLLFACWRVKIRHEHELTCIRSEDFIRVNRKHI